MITPEILAKLKEASAKATKGYWVNTVHSEYKNSHGIGFSCFASCPVHQNIHEECIPEKELLGRAREDAEFIALARNHIDSLIERVEYLEGFERRDDIESQKMWDNVHNKIKSLTAENAKMREALEELQYSIESVLDLFDLSYKSAPRPLLNLNENSKKASSCLASLDKKDGV